MKFPAEVAGTPPKDIAAALPFRDDVVPDDRRLVREIVASTGMFRNAEIDVAVELVDERLAKGPASGYHFLFAEQAGSAVGYACYGPIACTLSSYDLFWIAVRAELQGQGLGRQLLAASELRIRAMGGQRVYIETSGRPDYAPTRIFYERCGYVREASLHDFYGPGDDRLIYVRAWDAAEA